LHRGHLIQQPINWGYLTQAMSEADELLDFEKELEALIETNEPTAEKLESGKDGQKLSAASTQAGSISASDTPAPRQALEIKRPASSILSSVHPSRLAAVLVPQAIKPIAKPDAPRPPTATAAPLASSSSAGFSAVLTSNRSKPGVVLDESETPVVRPADRAQATAPVGALLKNQAPVANPPGYKPPFSTDDDDDNVAGKSSGQPPIPVMPMPTVMPMHPMGMPPMGMPMPPPGFPFPQPIGPVLPGDPALLVGAEAKSAEAQETEEKSAKKHLRYAAGKVWNDEKLAEWPEGSYDLFIGDLANDANDKLLESCFKHYPSFLKARVVRKRGATNKCFGFVAFADPFEMAKALREMNGKYCGSRPMTIKRSTSNQRDFNPQVHQKEKRVKLGL